METRSTHDLGEQRAETGSRRSLLVKTLLGAAGGLLPAAFLADLAFAFRTLRGCKKKCDRFSGTCKRRCRRCCKKVFRGNANHCDFGCGTIRRK
jgi:hypothetical protein